MSRYYPTLNERAEATSAQHVPNIADDIRGALVESWVMAGEPVKAMSLAALRLHLEGKGWRSFSDLNKLADAVEAFGFQIVTAASARTRSSARVVINPAI